MMLIATDGVKRIGWCQKVTRDELSPLVDELVERVLPVGTSCSPDDRLNDR